MATCAWLRSVLYEASQYDVYCWAKDSAVSASACLSTIRLPSISRKLQKIQCGYVQWKTSQSEAVSKSAEEHDRPRWTRMASHVPNYMSQSTVETAVGAARDSAFIC